VGLGWIEYTLPIKVHCHRWIQLSVEANKRSIDMVCFYLFKYLNLTQYNYNNIVNLLFEL
jgi:hypothetical protein